VAARCTEEDQLLSDQQLSRYDGGDTFAEEPCRLRYAHTSPIYVTVGGKGPCVPSSVKEGRAMLESFEHFSRKTATAEYLDELRKVMPREIKPVGD